MKSKLIKIGVPILAILAAVGIYGLREFNRKPLDLATAKAEFSVEAKAFYTEFNDNEKASFDKYRDKIVEVSGNVASIDKNENGRYSVTLAATEDGGVAVGLDSLASLNFKADAHAAGSPIKLRAVCTGIEQKAEDSGLSLLAELSRDVVLNRGVLVK